MFMAEEAQNNEMEDILSSIKNILEKDEQKQSSHTEETSLEDNVIVEIPSGVENISASESEAANYNDIETEEVDDILDLSPEMRIAEEQVKAVLAQDTDEEKEETTSNISETIDEEPAQNEIADVSDMVTEQEAEPIEESLSEDKPEPEQEIAEEEPAPIVENDAEPEPETASEYEVETEPEPEPSLDELLDTQGEISSFSDPLADSDNDSIFDTAKDEQDQSIEDLINSSSSPDEEINSEIKSIITQSDEAEEVELPKFIAEEAETATLELDEDTELPLSAEVAEIIEQKTEDTADVSANILSNFAKMFSKEEPKNKPETSLPSINYAGDTAKTLEEFVLEAITKVIGREISNQWQEGADFQSFAKEEIRRQTTAWINDNLPMLVEKIVKKEIERVIAKVGS